MKLSDHFKTAKSALLRGGLRTLLAVIGIMVGTGSVVALLSSGTLATNQALEQFKGLGINLLSFNFYPTNSKLNTTTNKVQPSTFKSIEQSIYGINSIAPYTTLNFSINFHSINWTANVIGVTQEIEDILQLYTEKGRFISELDKLQQFCVIGSSVAKKMNIIDPVGKQIRIGQLIYTVIGVLSPWEQSQFFPIEINDSILVPLKTLAFLSTNYAINTAVMQLSPETNVDAVRSRITAYFEQNLPGNQLFFQSSKELLKSMAEQNNIYTILLGCIGGIALFVGGIGVMNIMLASVAESRQEIGLRLALGAEPKDIQWMFLMEAAILALVGAGLGVLFGNVATYIISYFSHWPFEIFIFPSLLGFSVSFLISIFFGFYPAYVASQLNPIEILRGL